VPLLGDRRLRRGADGDDYASLWARVPTYSVLSPADVLPLFADLPPYRSPGLSFHYSNAGYVLLALLIEEVTGVAYVDVVAERVLGPAGMTESGFFALDEVRPPDGDRVPAARGTGRVVA